MLTKAFLSPTEIKERIAQEAASDKDRKLTPEQIEAIYSNGTNILVSASAGSGKTFVMVERILDMIGRGVGIDQLFISTFTVKAASWAIRSSISAGLKKALVNMVILLVFFVYSHSMINDWKGDSIFRNLHLILVIIFCHQLQIGFLLALTW